jgi:hypothetical protein
MDLGPRWEQSATRMGWFDRAKSALGLGGEEPAAAGARGKRGERPPLRDVQASSSASLDDALEEREAGRPEVGRAILQAIDRGKGLRTVLRAAAALEAGDEEELAPLATAIADSEPGWRLALQIASALGSADSEAALRDRMVAFAREHRAPEWALAWAIPTLKGKVDLLFADAPLARTVAAREWKVEGAADDRSAVERYAAFAHGRDAIRRFGPVLVAALFARVFEPAAASGVRS